MLTLYSQFLLQQAIKSPLYLMNPPVIEQDKVTLPRFTVLHYLDNETDSLFPERGSYYFREIPKNKKIPVKHVDDLLSLTETTNLQNKYLGMQIRRWSKENIRQFRNRDILETPNKDVATIAVVNYNTLKDLYNYKGSLLTEFHKHENISITYWSSIKHAVDSDPNSYQLASLQIPSVIPGFMTMNRLLGFTNNKLIRIVSDPALLWILELYRWLTDDTRDGSPLQDITDQDAEKILIEFKYKGYSAFLPLAILRSISEESELKSTMKVSNDRLQKVFILMLRKIQDQAIALADQSSELEESVEDDVESPEGPSDDDSEEHDEVDEHKAIVPLSGLNKGLKADPISGAEPVDAPPLKPLDTELDMDKLYIVGMSDINKLIDDEIDTDSFVEDLFEDKIKLVSNIAETPKVELKAKQVEEEVTEPVSPIREVDAEELNALLHNTDSTKITQDYIQTAIENKTHSAAELRALRKLQETRATLKSPYSEETLDSFVSNRPVDIKLDDELVKLDITNELVTSDLFTNKIRHFDNEYLTKVYPKDIAASVANIEKAGIIIKNYEKEETNTSTDRYETHKLTLKPLEGKESTVYFRLPKIDSEGSFMVGGVKYRMRKTRNDLPIRKISDTRVALTSNYGKFFVSRTERKANNRDSYIVDFIRKDYLGDNTVIQKIVPGTKLLNDRSLPNSYHLLSSNFDQIETANYTLMLRKDSAENHLEPALINELATKRLVFCGHNKSKDVLVVGFDNVFYNYSKDMLALGTIEDLLGLDHDKLPKSFSVIKVLGTDIPLGVAMGYYLGLSALLAITNTRWRVIGPRQQHSPSKDELVLRFQNYKLILTTDTIEKQLLFNGFTFYTASIKNYPLEAFDSKDVYLNVTEQRKTSLIHLKELTNLLELFLDPITVDVLKGMNEPTDFLPLLLRANELLSDYQYPDINDPHYSRIRGYDRVPGLLYMALAESVREYRVKGRRTGKISVDPYKVWNYITQDSSVKSRDELNPLLTLKEDEAVTLGGRGGLSSDAVPSLMRRFHPNDAGLISEGTVDSKDVALTSYLSPYAKLDGVRGTVKEDNSEAEANPAKFFSTPSMIAPMVEYDDRKRVNLIKAPLGSNPYSKLF